jgi:hypothetical protein
MSLVRCCRPCVYVKVGSRIFVCEEGSHALSILFLLAPLRLWLVGALDEQDIAQTNSRVGCDLADADAAADLVVDFTAAAAAAAAADDLVVDSTDAGAGVDDDVGAGMSPWLRFMWLSSGRVAAQPSGVPTHSGVCLGSSGFLLAWEQWEQCGSLSSGCGSSNVFC